MVEHLLRNSVSGELIKIFFSVLKLSIFVLFITAAFALEHTDSESNAMISLSPVTQMFQKASDAV